MECLDALNGGGCGCIYSHQPLLSRCQLSATCGRSLLLARTVRPAYQHLKLQRSAVTAIATAISALNVLSDVK
jgi:hypothetical protein